MNLLIASDHDLHISMASFKFFLNSAVPQQAPKANDSLVLDARNSQVDETNETDFGTAPPMKSNILEYMNISMELIKSLTQVSFKSIWVRTNLVNKISQFLQPVNETCASRTRANALGAFVGEQCV